VRERKGGEVVWEGGSSSSRDIYTWDKQREAKIEVAIKIQEGEKTDAKAEEKK